MKLFAFLIVFYPFTLILGFPKIHVESDDFYDQLEETLNNETRKFGPDEELMIPPDTQSKSANLFFSSILTLMERNTAQEMDELGAYSSEDTEIYLCGNDKKHTFAEFSAFIRLLHHLFKKINKLDSGFSLDDGAVSFHAEYNGVTHEDKLIQMKWTGYSELDTGRNAYIYKKFSLAGDCSGIPDSLPDHPTQPIQKFIDRLRSSLYNNIFQMNPRPTMHTYDTMSESFLFKKVRVQMCEMNGRITNSNELTNYMFTRYQNAASFSELAFSTEPFSSYQTNAIFSLKVDYPGGVSMREKYIFRIEEKRNKQDETGWVDWWTSHLTVDCPIDLNPKLDPKALQDKFIDHVCGSISPMINNGPSVESQSTFLSHMMKNENQGFWAIICYLGSAPKDYKYFSDTFLTNWSSNFDKAELVESKVNDYTNFEFTCVMKLTKNDGVVKKTDFKLRSFFEVDRWLVKEVRVLCEY